MSKQTSAVLCAGSILALTAAIGCGGYGEADLDPTGSLLQGQYGMFGDIDGPADTIHGEGDGYFEKFTVSQAVGDDGDVAFAILNLQDRMTGRSRVAGTYYASTGYGHGESLLDRADTGPVELDDDTAIEHVDDYELSVWLCGVEDGEMEDAVSDEVVMQVKPAGVGMVEVSYIATGRPYSAEDEALSDTPVIGSGTLRMPVNGLSSY